MLDRDAATKVLHFEIPLHPRDSNVLAEYIENWEAVGLATVIKSDTRYCILHSDNKKIILWPWPECIYYSQIDDTCIHLSDANPDNIIFFNDILEPPQGAHCFPSFFWGRHPALLEAKSQHWHHLKDRKINIGFHGRIENYKQCSHRARYLTDSSIDDMVIVGAGSQYVFDANQFYDRLLTTRYSICLRGFGVKTNRDIESAALGSVILVPKGSLMGIYRNSLMHGIHYLEFDPDYEVRPQLASISDEKWLEISANALDWYIKNCTFTASFDILSSIVQQITSGSN